MVGASGRRARSSFTAPLGPGMLEGVSMSCPGDDELNAFVGGGLGPQAASQIERHLEECSACRQLIHGLAHCLTVEQDGRSEVSIAGLARSAPPSARPLEVGDVVRGRYVILRHVASGSMGSVYRAYDDRLDRKVALKVLFRFERRRPIDSVLAEARAAARLAHPHVVVVHDVDHEDDRVFISMEYIEGQTLRRWQSQPRAPSAIVEVYAQAAAGLDAAHRAGLVHCDFKPDNVMIDHEGRVRVTDFGLALIQRLPSLPRAEEPTPVGLRGTPAYMAPELLQGARATPASDQFAFFVALHEALVAQRPTTLRDGEPTGSSRRSAITPSPRLPPALRTLVARGLEIEPAARHPSMSVVVQALGRHRGPRWWAWVLGAIVLVLIASLAYGRGETSVPACPPADGVLEGVWDDGRRSVVQRDLLEQWPAAEPGWAVFAERLDARASEWSALRHQACEASRRGERSADMLDRQMLCLQDVRMRVGGMLEELRQHPGGLVTRLDSLATQLPRVAPCGDLDGLVGQPRLPDDLDERAELLALRVELQRAEGLMLAGRYDECLGRFTSVIERATPLHLPTALQARLQRINVLRSMRRHDEARREAEYALQQAMVDEIREVMPALWAELGRTVFESGGEVERALFYLDNARVLAEARDQSYLLANIAMTRATALHYEGRLAEARVQYEHVVAAQEAQYGTMSPAVASTLNMFGLVDRDLGLYDSALAHFDRALEIRRAQLGERSSRVAAILNNRGSTHREQGRMHEAEADHQRALQIRTQLLEPDDVELGHVWLNLARLRRVESRLDEALGYAQHALRIYVAGLGDAHPDTLEARMELGIIEARRGQTAKARELWVAVLHRAEDRAVGRGVRLHALVELGELARGFGDLPRARQWLELAWDANIEQQPLRARAAFSLARVLEGLEVEPSRVSALALVALGAPPSRSAVQVEPSRVRAWLADRTGQGLGRGSAGAP